MSRRTHSSSTSKCCHSSGTRSCISSSICEFMVCSVISTSISSRTRSIAYKIRRNKTISVTIRRSLYSRYCRATRRISSSTMFSSILESTSHHYIEGIRTTKSNRSSSRRRSSRIIKLHVFSSSKFTRLKHVK
jgi:hypothetical protein